MSERYEQLYDDTWFAVSRRDGFMLACCDCGLVHRVSVRLRKGHIELRFAPDARCTASHRRAASVKRLK
jgi:hypothetical protein